MILKKFVYLFGVIAVLVITISVTVSAQFSSELWIRVSDDAGATNYVTLRFGNHINATYCVDDSLNPTIRETMGPPPSPGFDVRFVNIPGRVNCWDLGLIDFDFRFGTPSNPTQKDTFKIKFQNNESSSANFTFKWPSASYIQARCDSMVFVYVDPEAGTFRTNMATVDSLVIEAAGDKSISTATIYKYGCFIIDAVKQEKSVIPESFGLDQNFPNPFNPSTTLRFDIQKRAFTDVSVFNVLGQKVATLVSQELTPGTYSTVWNGTTSQGTPASTGVYYVRMIAHTNNADGKVEEFSALRKLLLVK